MTLHFLLGQVATPTSLWQLMGAIALFASIAGNVAMVLSLRTRKETRLIEPNPLEVRGVSAWVTESQCGKSHHEMQRQLDSHQVEIRNIWVTMHGEDEKTRNMLIKGLQDIERALGRIEGKLAGKAEE